MKKYKLGELIDVTRGMSLPGDKYAESGDLIRLTLGNFNLQGNGFKPNTSKTDIYFTGSVKKEFIMEKGDIITPLTEQTYGLLGSTARIPESGKYIQSQDVALIKSKSDKLYEDFCYYLISSPSVRKQLGAAAQQTKIRHTSPDKIKDCEVIIPEDVNQQIKITNLLNAIEDKIALNNKTNTELENMAKTIYNYWFTQFDFPDKNDHPYKTSGGQMVYNEILKREIPAGWEVKSLSQICELHRGVTYGKDDEMSESDENVVQILRGNNISNNHIVYDSNTVYVSSDLVTKEQKIKKFDIVITMSSGSKEHVGKSSMFLFDSPHSYGAFCNKLTPLNESQFFVENFMHSDFFKTYINHVCIGTGINNLKGEHFSKVYFAYPADSVLKQFNEIMKPIYEKRSYMEQANEELTKLRDYLLPLLMNGQIEVK